MKPFAAKHWYPVAWLMLVQIRDALYRGYLRRFLMGAK
jgi:hypothetical protein